MKPNRTPTFLSPKQSYHVCYFYSTSVTLDTVLLLSVSLLCINMLGRDCALFTKYSQQKTQPLNQSCSRSFTQVTNVIFILWDNRKAPSLEALTDTSVNTYRKTQMGFKRLQLFPAILKADAPLSLHPSWKQVNSLEMKKYKFYLYILCQEFIFTYKSPFLGFMPL